MLSSIETLRGFLYSSVYSQANAQIEDSRVEHVLTSLFKYRIQKCKENPQEAVDFISGMTDRFALQLFKDVYVPSPWIRSRA
jgi:dGTPase